MRQSKSEKAIDRRIDEHFNRNHRGVQIDIMDISKIFKAGRAAALAGMSIEDAVDGAVAELRKN